MKVAQSCLLCAAAAIGATVLGSSAAAGEVGGSGSYQTRFEIAVPPAPAAPSLALSYDSATNGSLAGVGWDLSVGWPVSIVRDVRLGTPEWKLDSAWLWGTSPLVPKTPSPVPGADPFDCAGPGQRQYRTAPDTLACVGMDFTAGQETARVLLPTGTTLNYEPIVYEGMRHPAAPAGNETTVFAFRLASATDRNGYRTCFAYQDFVDPQRGKADVLKEITYGPTPSEGGCGSPAFRALHRVELEYDDLLTAGFFETWTLRFGAPVTFNSLLKRVRVYAANVWQDEFALVHDGATSETRRPRLVRIDQVAPDPANPAKTVTRSVRAFVYGDRNPQYGDATGEAELLDIGPAGSFPDSLSGAVSRPIRRSSLLGAANVFQIGQDQDTDAAPPSHAVTEQWSFVDVNGDGLPDLQWGKEKGADPAATWPTFEAAPPPFSGAVSFGQRPAQQQVLINDGIAASRLGTSPALIDSHAPALEQAYAPVPTIRDAVPITLPTTYTSWIWGEGHGLTRTGMPVSISAPEIPRPSAVCPPAKGEDTRLWPLYPDGTFGGSRGSIGQSLLNAVPFPPGGNMYIGNPVMSIGQQIYDSYHPSYSVSSTVSGWADLDGDGVPEFVATPNWIDRFSLEAACVNLADPATLPQMAVERTLDSFFARNPDPARTPAGVDTAWHAGSLAEPVTGATNALTLSSVSGPPGPVGLPISYDISTGAPHGFGFTLPVGSLAAATISSIMNQSWIPIAAAAPGLTVDSFAPRSQPGYSLSKSAPSATSVMQGIGSVARSGGSGGSIGDFIMSVVKVNFDVTLLASPTTNRSETRAQLMDFNADGLPDYLLYNGNGDLVAYLNSPTGFGGAIVVNTGFGYPSGAPALTAIDADVDTMATTAKLLTNPAIEGPCSTAGVPSAGTACVPYGSAVLTIAAAADRIVTAARPLMAVTKDAIPRERSHVDELEAQSAAVKAGASWLMTPLTAPSGIGGPLLVDTTTAVADSLVQTAGYVARTLRQLGFPSRINAVSRGFSHLDGTGIGNSAAGWAVQTRGFVDLNGDALPDYVVADDRESLCPAGQWQVFWGTGTSSRSAGRGFLTTHSCLPVPAIGALALPARLPDVRSRLTSSGFTTLPLSVDIVERAPTASAAKVDTQILSYVSLNDVNRDGRPDIVVAGYPTDTLRPGLVWYVFRNNGSGFETSAGMSLANPKTLRQDVEVASPQADAPQVLYPSVRTTHADATILTTISRDTTETHAALIDIDGDGSPEVLRRVHIKDGDPATPDREGLLAWARRGTGPQDFMIEDRDPLQGGRALVEYKPATAFQWTDAKVTGQPPQGGHYSVAGAPGLLVRSLTREPLLGRPEGRTRVGFQYRLPQFDKATRTPIGFALRASVPLDPATGEVVVPSAEESQRAGQRPDLVAGVTHTRVSQRPSGAPISESLVSRAEVPTTTGGIGGLRSVFSAPTRRFTVEYPSGLASGAIFDVGFDGRQPFRDRVASRGPLGGVLPALEALAATGGAARWPATGGTGVVYASPHLTPGAPAAPLVAATVEAWVHPTFLTGEHTIVDSGAYRLSIAPAANGYRIQLAVSGGPVAMAASPLTADRWHHVVASFGQGAVRLFVDGRDEGSVNSTTTPTPAPTVLVGCAGLAGGGQGRCFVGEIGELRIYPEAWTAAPRVTDTETELQVAAPTRFDFGQPRRVLARSDMARAEDDVVTEYEYAAPLSPSRVFGLPAVESKRSLAADGTTSGDFLAHTETSYDGLPVGQARAGNPTRRAQYDGQAATARPTLLRVATSSEYLDPSCPGRATKVTDAAGFSTRTTLDRTCTFAVQMENALGHLSRTRYYGIDQPATPALRVSGPYGVFSFRGRYGQIGQTLDANAARTLSTYDEWGRPLAVWSPLDREDRPGVRFEYADAVCEERILVGGAGGVGEQTEDVPAPCHQPAAFTLHTPARVTTYTWDDQLRRCQDSGNRYVPCSSPSASAVADEPGTGAYTVSHAFGDGQTQAQTLDNGQPGWNVAGTSDFDARGRRIREYKIRYLPRQAATGLAACPAPGEWCDSSRLAGDPLRKGIASVQLAYDAQDRMLRIYGPGVPPCPGDPSALTPAGDLACDARIPTTPPGDVTKLSYPAPGVTRTEDANGVPQVVRNDARGLLTVYEEYLKTSPQPYATVQNAYDPMGRVGTVTDQAGNVRRSQYDALSRLIASEDPDLGRTTYAYDLRSQLVERLVASGEKTQHKYDALGRVTQTDYLRPRSVPSLPVCCNLDGGDLPVRVYPDDSCAIIPGLTPPIRLTPGGPPAPTHPALDPLVLARGDLDKGEARFRLPFDLSLRGPKGGVTFPKGTPMSISTDGSITLRGRGPGGGADLPGSAVDATLDVFSADLVLHDGGLRVSSDVVGGERALVIEWDGRVGQGNEPVQVRAILSEAAPALRYEYVRVPRDFRAEVGVHLKGGGLELDAKPLQIAAGNTLELDDRTPSGVRLDCSRGRGGIRVPLDPRRLTGDRMRLRYRVFSECDTASPGDCALDALSLSYRRGDSRETRELARPTYVPRPFERRQDVAGQDLDSIDIEIPPELRKQRFDLELTYRGAFGDRPFVLDLASIDVGATVYEPEERVYRTYDSSEPPYFHEPKAGGGLAEARPLLDLSFDVEGRPEDRSPTASPWQCSGAVESAVGASGRALALAAGTQCRASGLPAGLAALTAELWIRPGEVQQPQTVWTLGSALTDFSMGVLADGRVWCGPTASRVTGHAALRSDAWSHVAVVFDGSSVRCLVNGEAQGSATLPAGTVAAVGSTLTLQGGTAGAAVDEVRLIAGARSDAEILEDALRPLAGGPPRGNLLHLGFGDPAAPGADTSKAGNGAVLAGGDVVPGVLGMVFDTGAGGQVSVAHSTTLGLSDKVTAETWMKTRNGRGGPARLIGKWDGGPGWRLDLQDKSGRLRWEVITEVRPAGGGTPQRQRTVFVTYEQVNDDRWHHVAGTYDGRRMRVFIDGRPAHRWCSPVEDVRTDPCTEPPKPTKCAIETTRADGQDAPTLGDAVCVEGSIDNSAPVLIANDGAGAEFDGWIDEARLSNYAKREFEVAASARLASAYSQSIGRETLLRNQLPVGDALDRQVAREQRAFDVEGRAASWFKRVRGQTAAGAFVARAASDGLARVGTLEYPQAEVVASTFSLGGLQDSLVGYGPDAGAAPAQAQPYVTRASATVTGKLAGMLYGNGVSGAWTYDDALTAAGGFGPETLKTSTISDPAGTALSDRAYQWNAVRSLASVTDTAPAASFAATYGHDDLRRIASAALTLAGQTSTYAYGYDALGNLRSKEGVTQDFGRATLASSCPANAPPIPHALTRRIVGGSGDRYCYDASGRLVESVDTPGNSIRHYSYFARGKVSRLTDRNGESEFAYDGSGLRVRKLENGAAQTVPFVFFRELPTGREATYAVGGRMVSRRALSANPELVWFSTDHLDGTHFLTGAGGAEVPSTRAYYRPFGAFANTRPQTEKSGNRQFTSKELDQSGLYDFGARPYDPVTGSFTQADEIDLGSSPRAQSRYAYVLNNPLTMVDPTGHQAAEVTSDTRWQTVADGSGTERVPIEPYREGATLGNYDSSRLSLFGQQPTVWENAWQRSSDDFRQPTFQAYLNQGYYDSGWSFKDYTFFISGQTTAGWFSPYDLVGSIGGGAGRLAEGAAGRALLAEGATPRGLSKFGGIFTSETNAAGGTVWTSVGRIAQSDVEDIVNRTLVKSLYGGPAEIEILTGVHGMASGAVMKHAQFLVDDIARFGSLPGVTVRNVLELSGPQLRGILAGRGTIIGAFCDSAACLSSFH